MKNETAKLIRSRVGKRITGMWKKFIVIEKNYTNHNSLYFRFFWFLFHIPC